jgi:hypothetical protein
VADLKRQQTRGWEVLELTTDAIAVTVLPGLGGAIWSLLRRADQASLLHSTPWGLPQYGAPALPGDSRVQAMSTFGGWQTVFPNGGDAAMVQGIEWAFDGEARLTPLDWDYTGTSLIMNGRLRHAPFTLTRTISLRGHELSLGETVRNVGGEQVATMWGSQLTLGGDLLGPDTILDTAAAVVRPDPIAVHSTTYDDLSPWPRTPGSVGMVNLRTVPAPTATESRLAYLSDFTRPWLQVTRPDRQLGLDLEWDDRCWPHVWYRLEAGGQRDFPWYGTGYFLGLTPCTSWPAHGLHEARRVAATTLSIPPGATRTSYVTLTVHPA